MPKGNRKSRRNDSPPPYSEYGRRGISTSSLRSRAFRSSAERRSSYRRSPSPQPRNSFRGHGPLRYDPPPAPFTPGLNINSGGVYTLQPVNQGLPSSTPITIINMPPAEPGGRQLSLMDIVRSVAPPTNTEPVLIPAPYWNPPDWDSGRWFPPSERLCPPEGRDSRYPPRDDAHRNMDLFTSRNREERRRQRSPPPSTPKFRATKLLAIFKDQTKVDSEIFIKIQRFSVGKSPYSSEALEDNTRLPLSYLDAATAFKNLLKAVSPKEIKAEAALPKALALPVNQQLEALVVTQTLSLEQLRVRWQFCFDLFALLRPNYPNLKIVPYGSIKTGFQLNPPSFSEFNTDVAIFLELNEKNQLLRGKQLRRAVLDCKETLSRKTCPQTGKSFVKKFVEQDIVSGAYPVIQFVHGPSNLTCQLTFGNNVNVRRSKWMEACLATDKRIRPFFVLFQYWAKFHGVLEGTQEDDDKTPRYALFLLAMTFLMEKGILNAESLQQKLELGKDTGSYSRRANYSEEMTVEVIGWMEDLFENGFLDEFDNVVVSPLVGELVPLKDFDPENVNNLPEKLRRIVKARQTLPQDLGLRQVPMVIQDAVLPYVNVCRGRSAKAVEELKKWCRSSKRIAEENKVSIGKTVFGLLVPDLKDLNWEESVEVEQEEITIICDKELAWEGTFEVGAEFVEGYMRKVKGPWVFEAMKEGKLEQVMKMKMQETWKAMAGDFVEKMMVDGLSLEKVAGEGEGMTFRVAYPFWKNREDEGQNYGKGENPVIVEKVKSKEILDFWLEGGNEKETTINVEHGGTSPSKKRRRLGNFKQFSLEVLSKFKSAEEENGMAALKVGIFKLPNPENKRDDQKPVQDAVKALSRIFQQAFPAHQAFQLDSTASFE